MLPSNNGEIVFFDNFTSEELDRTKWNVEITGKIYNDEQQAYIDSPDTIYLLKDYENANGVLIIQPRFRKGFVTPQGNIFDFVSGRIHTRGKFEFTYGRLSARIKIPEGEGLWPAFWTKGSRGSWPDCGELDVMEAVGEPDWSSAAVHGPRYSGESALVNKKYFILPEKSAQWHIYALEWTPDYLCFFVDEEIIFRVSRPMVEFFGPWVFDKSQHLVINLALGGRYPFKTNGINEAYYGMSEAAVQTIINNKAALLVDWVKVIKDL